MFSIAPPNLLFLSVSGFSTAIQKVILTKEYILLMSYCTKSWKNGENEKKRKTWSSVNSDTSREISVHNGSLLNGASGDEAK